MDMGISPNDVTLSDCREMMKFPLWPFPWFHIGVRVLMVSKMGGFGKGLSLEHFIEHFAFMKFLGMAR